MVGSPGWAHPGGAAVVVVVEGGGGGGVLVTHAATVIVVRATAPTRKTDRVRMPHTVRPARVEPMSGV